MRILHIGPLNVKSGGPTLSTYLVVKGIEQYGCYPAVLTMPLAEGDKWYAEDVCLYLTKNNITPAYGFIPQYNNTLKHLPAFNIVHLQGLWMHLFHGGAKFARKRNIPYIISLRGNLYPQALGKHKLIKQIFRRLFQDNDLKRAACIHATCEDELRFYRNLGFKNPVAVIPNPISTEGVLERPVNIKNDLIIGYLGRLHPRKRIEKLISAIDFLNKHDINIKLRIIGSGAKDYEDFLKNEVSRLKLNNVEFTGFLVGEEKDRAISELSVLACVSDFENFGNIVTEALVRGVPVITTKGMPWESLIDYSCGWWIDNDQEVINNTLLKISSLTKSELQEMGKNGKKMIQELYTIEAVGNQFTELYQWILNKGNCPKFVDVL